MRFAGREGRGGRRGWANRLGYGVWRSCWRVAQRLACGAAANGWGGVNGAGEWETVREGEVKEEDTEKGEGGSESIRVARTRLRLG